MSRAAQRNRRLAKLEAEAGLAGRGTRAMLERERDRLQARSSAQLAAAIASGDSDQLEAWLAAHMAGSASGEVERLDEIVAIVRRTGALDITREAARAEAERARAHISALPSSQFKDALLRLTVLAVDRTS